MAMAGCEPASACLGAALHLSYIALAALVRCRGPGKLRAYVSCDQSGMLSIASQALVGVGCTVELLCDSGGVRTHFGGCNARRF